MSPAVPDALPTDLADRVWAARTAGDFAPAWLVGHLSLEQALDLQLDLLARKQAAGARLGGWKVGLTSERARRMLGADERPFGHVLADRVIPSGTTLDTATMHHPSVECELCVTIGRTIGGPGTPAPTRDELFAAIERVSAGFELNERRPGSAKADFTTMVADCLTNWGIVVGSGVAPPSADALNGITISLTCNGEERYRGVSRDELDDHVTSLGRLVETLAAHGRALEAGMVVITGAVCRFDVAPGETWRATYGGLGGNSNGSADDVGVVEVTFT